MEKTIKLDAEKETLEALTDVLEQDLAQAGCPQEVLFAVLICAEEIFVNIASYAYPESVGIVIIKERIGQGCVTLVFEDEGIAYDPLEKEDPDLELSAEERLPGGLGIYMTKTMMDEISYEYRDGCNILAMTKRWDEAQTQDGGGDRA